MHVAFQSVLDGTCLTCSTLGCHQTCFAGSCVCSRACPLQGNLRFRWPSDTSVPHPDCHEIRNVRAVEGEQLVELIERTTGSNKAAPGLVELAAKLLAATGSKPGNPG